MHCQYATGFNATEYKEQVVRLVNARSTKNTKLQALQLANDNPETTPEQRQTLQNEYNVRTGLVVTGYINDCMFDHFSIVACCLCVVLRGFSSTWNLPHAMPKVAVLTEVELEQAVEAEQIQMYAVPTRSDSEVASSCGHATVSAAVMFAALQWFWSHTEFYAVKENELQLYICCPYIVLDRISIFGGWTSQNMLFIGVESSM